MNKKTFPLLLATTLVLGACTNEDLDNGYDADAGKYKIELGAAGDNATSRAGFTEAATTLKLHYESTRQDYNESSFPYKDGEGKGTLYMTSSATAAVNTSTEESAVSAVSQTTGADGTQRYWDDVHGKNSKVSIYAIAVADKDGSTKNSSVFSGYDTSIKEGSSTALEHKVAWTISTEQTSNTIADEDLVYSNNLKGDNALKFIHSTKKFETATGDKSLIFNHALSRITINVKKGDGFGDFSDTEFNITAAKLSGMTTASTLTVSDGTMSSTTTNQDVSFIGTKTDYKPSDTKLGYTFCAQVLPGVTLKDVTSTMLTFVVDGNNYYIKGSEIYDALTDESLSLSDDEMTNRQSLKQGKNYQLTVTINKTGVSITSAKLVDWTNITGKEMVPSNAIALTTTMESSAGDASKVVASNIYRSTDVATGYNGTDNTRTLAADGKTLGSAWYWPDNSTSYYFRTISPQGTTVTTAASPVTNDYITMTGGAIATTNDYIWGAPLEEKHSGSDPHTFTYSTTDGYNTYLHPAIGATKSEIHITQFHMMSNIAVKLTTSTDGSAVDLSGATVKLIGHKTTGTLNLSNALIATTGDASSGETLTVDGTHTASTANFTWRTVPQSLDDVTFVISANGNNYTVNLKDILVDGSENKITSWLPGQAYTYQFKITKTGIVISSAKLVDWLTVTGTIKDITLEN